MSLAGTTDEVIAQCLQHADSHSESREYIGALVTLVITYRDQVEGLLGVATSGPQ